MKIFVISLKSYKERREFQIKQAKNLELDITFIDAIDGSSLSTKELQDAANLPVSPARLLRGRPLWTGALLIPLQMAGVLARQIVGGERGGRRRAPGGEFAAVDHRQPDR